MDKSVSVTVRGVTLSAYVDNSDGLMFLLVGFSALLILTAIGSKLENNG